MIGPICTPSAPWPKASAKESGYKFRGYKLTDDNRPTFFYDFGEIQIQDFPTGVATKPYLTLKRTLKLTNPASNQTAIFFGDLV